MKLRSRAAGEPGERAGEKVRVAEEHADNGGNGPGNQGARAEAMPVPVEVAGDAMGEILQMQRVEY